MSLTPVKDGRETLIAATLSVLDRDGVDGVTLRAVGKAAHVSAPAAYWHFEDKDMLLAAVLKEIAAEFIARLRNATAGAPPAERMPAVGDAFIGFVIDYPHRFQLLFRQPPRRPNKPLRRPPQRDTSFGVLVEVVEQSIADGTLRREDPTSVALTVAALGQGLVQLLERGRFTDRDEFAEFARISFRRLLHGLAV